jgi:hypothetical protein
MDLQESAGSDRSNAITERYSALEKTKIVCNSPLPHARSESHRSGAQLVGQTEGERSECTLLADTEWEMATLQPFVS